LHRYAEDEEKHAYALRSATRAGNRLLTYEDIPQSVEEEPTPEVFESVDGELSAASEPTSYLPNEVGVANAATVATWQDYLPYPRDSKPRAVSMLWGFVHDALKNRLNIARRVQLEALTSTWDATRSRSLLLRCDILYEVKATKLNLRHEIEPQIDKLLSDFLMTYKWSTRPRASKRDERPVARAPGDARPGGVNK
jgi:hypothetical protein